MNLGFPIQSGTIAESVGGVGPSHKDIVLQLSTRLLSVSRLDVGISCPRTGMDGLAIRSWRVLLGSGRYKGRTQLDHSLAIGSVALYIALRPTCDSGGNRGFFPAAPTIAGQNGRPANRHRSCSRAPVKC